VIRGSDSWRDLRGGRETCGYGRQYSVMNGRRSILRPGSRQPGLPAGGRPVARPGVGRRLPPPCASSGVARCRAGHRARCGHRPAIGSPARMVIESHRKPIGRPRRAAGRSAPPVTPLPAMLVDLPMRPRLVSTERLLMSVHAGRIVTQSFA